MFRRRSRRAVRIVPLLMAALLLASCAVPGTGEDRPVTLTYWSWTSGSQELADRFNATHDHIRVTFEKVPAGTAGGYSKMFNAVKAGKAPDVVAVEYPQLPGFVTQQVLQPLDPYGVTDLGDQYPDWAWRQVALGGQVYGLPMNIGPTVMFYRTDLFAEYGLTPPTTWEEFRTTAETVAAEHPGVTLTNFGTNDAALLAGLAWQAGARWFDSGSGHWQVDATDEAGARFAGYWESLIDDGLVTARPTFAEQHVTQLQQGTSLTVLAAPWTAANIQRFAPDLAGRWGAAPLPAWPEGPASGNYGGSSLAVPRGADHPEEAMEFIRWVSTSPDAVEAVAQVNTSYPANTTLTDHWGTAIEAANPYVAGMDLPAAAGAAARTVNPAWEWGPDMTEGFARLVDEATAWIGRPEGIRTALARWQDTTVDQLRQRGFTVPE
ncbi:sugar ABC transporter substrate-binding protein [Streptomyces carpaticus]|uniref:ABC transporter substrate-binding protein n=1 Tax=Streptomyces TaxID=1883 RepID=UPI00220408B6|nr:sugar ABC transporter substrate-binding protein [Streptomyces carpaticus]